MWHRPRRGGDCASSYKRRRQFAAADDGLCIPLVAPRSFSAPSEPAPFYPRAGRCQELSPIFGDGLMNQAAARSLRLGGSLKSAGKFHSPDDLWQLVMTIEPAPAFLGALDEFEDHGESGLI
jgi:hypothetical protein